MSTNESGTNRQLGPHDCGSIALPTGFTLSEFQIESVLGEGGFGIVYLARDLNLERLVAVKEYMPSSLASRQPNLSIAPRSEQHRETFELGRRSFINEARMLARFDHPALVKVLRFWEGRGTAYMAMPYYRGPTLKQHLRLQAVGCHEPPHEEWLRGLLAPLLDALEHLHGEDVLHRDIAPDNILLLPSGAPLLLDFGAARRVITDRGQALTVILKAGYAPLEQYAQVLGVEQGPWTDIYALAATMYWTITGETPPPAIDRSFRDTYLPLEQRAAGRYSKEFLRAIDHALAVMPQARTASVAQFRSELEAPPALDPQATVLMRPASQNESTVLHSLRPAALPPAAAMPTPAPAAVLGPTATGTRPPNNYSTSELSPSKPRRAVRVLAMSSVLVASTVGWAVWKFHSPEPAPRQAAVQDRQPAAVASEEPVGAQVAASSPVAPASDLPAPKQQQQEALEIVASSAASRLATENLPPKLDVRINRDSFVYVVDYETKSKAWRLLFPRYGHQPLRYPASEVNTLPRDQWADIRVPPGRWQLHVLASTAPISFDDWQPSAGVLRRHSDAVSGKFEVNLLRLSGCDHATNCDDQIGHHEIDLVVEPKTPAGTAPSVTPRKEQQALKPPVASSPSGNVECASLVTRLSLGEDAPPLIARMKDLGCR